MVNESSYWKIELNRQRILCKKTIARKRITEKAINTLEISLMIACFLLRKILDSRKFSEEIEDLFLNVKSYRNLNKSINRLDRYDIDKYFDLKNYENRRFGIRELTNSFMHSYVFLVGSEIKRFDSVYICSDRDKNKFLFKCSMSELLSLFKRAASDEILDVSMRKCDQTGEWLIASAKSQRQLGKKTKGGLTKLILF